MRLICSSLVSSLLFLAASALPAPQHSIPTVNPSLVYPRNHTLETCPLETWAFPNFGIASPAPYLSQTVELPATQYWNASLLEREPISGGASNDLSYFQGPLAPDVLACQIYGYVDFINSGQMNWVSTHEIILEPGIQYAFSYTLNKEVTQLSMRTSYGIVPLSVGHSEIPGENLEVVGFAWSQNIGSAGRLGGVEFMLKQQLTVTFFIDTDIVTGDPLAGSLAVFKQGP